MPSVRPLTGPSRPSPRRRWRRWVGPERLEPRRLLAAGAVGDLDPVTSRSWEATGEGEAVGGALVGFRLAATNLLGQPISTIAAGQDFLVQAYVQDLRSVPLSGIFAAYLDIAHSLNAFPLPDTGNPLGFNMSFSADYGNGKTARLESGLIDEAGAFQSGSRPLGSSEKLVFQVRFRADGFDLRPDQWGGIPEDSVGHVLDVLANDAVTTGRIEFRGDAPDVFPAHEILFFDPPEPVPTSNVRFAPASLNLVDQNSLRITEVTQPGHGGTVTIAADGRHLLYTPAANFYGDETFAYTVAGTRSASVTVRVDPTNDPPRSVSDAYEAERNTTLTVTADQGVLANDEDVERDPLRAELVTRTSHGTIELAADGGFRYTPAADFRGTDRFTYVASDGRDESAEATVELAVDPPRVQLRLEVTDVDGNPVEHVTRGQLFDVQVHVKDLRSVPTAGVYAAYLDLLYDAAEARVVPAPGSPLGFEVDFRSGYVNGLSGAADTPGWIDNVGGFQESEDPVGADDMVVFSMRFEAAGAVAQGDSFPAILEDSLPIQLDVLANDQRSTVPLQFSGQPSASSPRHDIVLYSPPEAVAPDDVVFSDAVVDVVPDPDLEIASIGPTSHGGSVELSSDRRSVIYRPAADFVGDETFTYRLAAGGEAQVTVQVAPLNDAPAASEDQYPVRENRVLEVPAAAGLLSNDLDVDGDPLTVELLTRPQHGELLLEPDGGFIYTPPQNFVGPDLFTYRATDGQEYSAPATVRLDFTPAPVRIDLSVNSRSGELVTAATVGDPLVLSAFVRDQRGPEAPSRGVFAAYLDVRFDDEFVSVPEDLANPLGFDVTFGPEYSEAGRGDQRTPGLINEIGSFQRGFDPLGADRQLLFEVGIDLDTARAADDSYVVSQNSQLNLLDPLVNDRELVWLATLVAEPADIRPDSDTLLFEPPSPLPPADVHYESVSITVRNRDDVRIIAISAPASGALVTVAGDEQLLRYQPVTNFTGTDILTYTLQDDRGFTATATLSVEVRASWQNLRHPLDVNSDSLVTPQDALILINDLNTTGARELEGSPITPPFPDVSGDRFLSPVDALLVINYLNSRGAPTGEGERLVAEAASMGWPSLRDGTVSGLDSYRFATWQTTRQMTPSLPPDVLSPRPPRPVQFALPELPPVVVRDAWRPAASSTDTWEELLEGLADDVAKAFATDTSMLPLREQGLDDGAVDIG